MIRDFEELLLQIKKQDIRDYMTESVKCYNVGSYRASIILATIAGMHDLRQKIKSLARSMKEFRNLDNELDERIKKEEPYERYMVENAEKLSILSSAESTSIETYLDLRNRCAHPNEFNATAEEARMVFTGFFDNVIRKPTLLGAAYTQNIINRLENDYFFPDQDISKVVQEELNKLHDKAVLPLVAKLINVIDQEKGLSTIKFENAILLLKGILIELQSEEKIKQIAEKISPLAESERLLENVIDFISSYPRLISFFSEADKERVISYLKKSINPNLSDKTILIIRELLSSNSVQLDRYKRDITNLFKAKIEKTIEIDMYNSVEISSVDSLNKWVNVVMNLKNTETDRSFFRTLIRLIDNGNFIVSTEAINLLNRLDKEFINKRMDGESIVELFTAFINQAKVDREYRWGLCFAARDLWDNKFKDYSELYSRFVDYVTNDYDKYCVFYDGVFEGKTALFTILIELNEPSLMENVLDFMNKKHEGDDQLELNNYYHELKRLQHLLDETEGETWNEVELKVKKYMEVLESEL